MAGKKANSTSFTSATAPRHGGRKGVKQNKTKVKEAAGLDGWASLERYLLNKGAKKLVESIDQLKPKDFVIAYQALAEFVKPKLSRRELTGEVDQKITFNITKTYATDTQAD